MGSEALPSAFYILSDESSILFYSTSKGYKRRSVFKPVIFEETSLSLKALQAVLPMFMLPDWKSSFLTYCTPKESILYFPLRTATFSA